jgi:hypothetical protein
MKKIIEINILIMNNLEINIIIDKEINIKENLIKMRIKFSFIPKYNHFHKLQKLNQMRKLLNKKSATLNKRYQIIKN